MFPEAPTTEGAGLPDFRVNNGFGPAMPAGAPAPLSTGCAWRRAENLKSPSCAPPAPGWDKPQALYGAGSYTCGQSNPGSPWRSHVHHVTMESAQLIASGLGLIVGFILSLTGAGGAILSVPLLVFGLHLTVSQAAPIGLLAVSVSAGVGALFALRAGILRYRAAGFMALFGLMLSPVGLWLAARVPNKPLTMVFAFVLLYVSARMMHSAWREIRGLPEAPRKAPPCLLNASIGRLIWTVPCARSLAIAGATAGFFSGLLGVGGGFIIVPSLRRVTDLPINAIIATSMGVLTLVSAGSVAIASASGDMLWRIAVPFAFGSLCGLIVGRHFARRIPGAWIQQSFAVLALGVSISMFVKSFGM